MIGAALIAFAVACVLVCARLRTRRGAALFAVAVFALLAFGVPLAELGIKCAQPASEGCVWGKSLLPVSLAIGSVIGAVVAGGAFLIALAFQRRRRLAAEPAGEGPDSHSSH